MKIAIVAENYFPSLGGIQEHVRHLRNFLLGQNVEVTILTGAPALQVSGPIPADANDHVVRVGKARHYGTGGTVTQATAGPSVWWNVRKALGHGNFDVVNIHGPCDFGLPFFALTQFKGPKVLTLHSCFPDSRMRHFVAPYYRWVMNQAAAIVAVSEATKAAMQRYATFNADVIPNGVDVSYWRAGRPKRKYQSAGLRNIVFLGRLEARNGPDLAISAMAEILKRVPDVRLLMAGDGPLRETLEANVDPSIRDRVEFIGSVYDERADLLASSSLFLLPARAVGFSIMVLEAFAAGLPVVALPALGVSQAGGHWSNVHVAADESADAFASAAIELLTNDQLRRIARGRRIAQQYDWAAVGPQILDVFERVVHSRAFANPQPRLQPMAMR